MVAHYHNTFDIGKVRIHEHKLTATGSNNNNKKIMQELVKHSSKIIRWKPWHHNQNTCLWCHMTVPNTTSPTIGSVWTWNVTDRNFAAWMSQTWAECSSDDVTVVFCLLALCNSKQHLLNHILILALSDSHCLHLDRIYVVKRWLIWAVHILSLVSMTVFIITLKWVMCGFVGDSRTINHLLIHVFMLSQKPEEDRCV